MSISSEITRISNAKTAIAESITNKGVTVPSGTKIDGMAALIDSIQTGGSGTAVQPSKALTVTSNGTTTITPDAPYDAIKQVDLTVNVSGGGGSVETCTLTTKTGKAPGARHGTIYAYNGDTLITITSKGTYSINKNSLIYVEGAFSMDGYTGLSILYSIAGSSVCNVTSDIAEYTFNG